MKRLVLAAMMLSLAGTAQADGFALGVNIGTPGLGLQGTWGLTKSLNIRGVANFYSGDFDESDDGIDYELDFDLQSVGALIDWHPAGGGFRISAGAFSNGNGADGIGQGTSGTLVEFGGQVFAAEDLGQVGADLDYDGLAPYLGIGWGNAVREAGWSFNADVGVFFQGDSDVALVLVNVDPAIEAAALAEIPAAEASLEDEIDNFELYPYVSVGFAYRF